MVVTPTRARSVRFKPTELRTTSPVFALKRRARFPPPAAFFYARGFRAWRALGGLKSFPAGTTSVAQACGRPGAVTRKSLNYQLQPNICPTMPAPYARNVRRRGCDLPPRAANMLIECL